MDTPTAMPHLTPSLTPRQPLSFLDKDPGNQLALI